MLPLYKSEPGIKPIGSYSLFISGTLHVNRQYDTRKIARFPDQAHHPVADTLFNKAGGQRTHRPNQVPEPGKSLEDEGATKVGWHYLVYI